MRLSSIYRRLLLVTLLMLAGTIAACGSEDSTSNTGPVEVSGVSSKDRRIAADLREYIKPCPDAADEIFSEARQAEAREALKPGSRAEERVIRQYGSVDAAFKYEERTCASFQRIEVKDWVITVKTSLGSTDTQNAADICNTIQGADEADYVPGHTILGKEDQVLARCRPLTDYESLPNPVQRRCERNPARCRA